MLEVVETAEVNTMAKFPDRESEVMVLCAEIAAGLTAHPEVYPAPPVDSAALEALLGAALTASEAAQEAKAVYAAKTEAKQAAFAALKQGMKDDLRYAELITHRSDDLLKLLGWKGWHREVHLAAPGQALDLRIAEEGPGWLELSWRKPKTGGKPAVYRVERQRLGGNTWEIAGVALGRTARIEHQERGVEFVYRVVASNKAGEATPSNSVVSVL